MPLSVDELADISNSTLEVYLDRGRVFKQNIENKPMLKAFDAAAGKFPGGKEAVSFAVASGQGGGSLVGYTGDDQVSYYNPTGTKRARFLWKEHHIGMTMTMSQLKTDGIDIVEDGSVASQEERRMSGREMQVLANMLDENNEKLGEDYARGLDSLIHGDGTSDSKALAGIKSLILDDPSLGSTGGVSRTANTWWRNRAATTAANAAGSGSNQITSATAGGGALLKFLQKESLQLSRYDDGSTKRRWFAGSDFIDALHTEMRANGYYTQTGWSGGKAVDGKMGMPLWGGEEIVYDPTLDLNSLAKRCYVIDMGKSGIRMLYMDGQRMKRHRPARPYDRYVVYQGITTTAVLVAKKLRTSAVYDIA